MGSLFFSNIISMVIALSPGIDLVTLLYTGMMERGELDACLWHACRSPQKWRVLPRCLPWSKPASQTFQDGLLYPSAKHTWLQISLDHREHIFLPPKAPGLVQLQYDWFYTLSIWRKFHFQRVVVAMNSFAGLPESYFWVLFSPVTAMG